MAAYDELVAQQRSRTWRMLIGGELRESVGGRRFESVDPATEQVIAQVPDADERDVELAVQAAEEGFARWRRMAPRERARIVREMARRLLEHEEELGLLDALDSGNPYTAMKGDVRMAAEQMELFADWALELKGETIPATAEHLHYTLREPYGVVARIIPYNHPIMFAASRIAAPLVAGNAVILKPAEQTPLSALRMGELVRDLLPPGVLNILVGRGAELGQAIVRHPRIRRIGFTGSVATGRAVQRTAAEGGVKVVTLELGGKNPMIVFPDADPDKAAAGAVQGMNFGWCTGQSCGSTSRLFLHESIADAVLERVRELVQRIRIGMPLDAATEMGPVVSREQYDKVMHYIRLGREQGARLVLGGGRPAGLERGYFVAPTVFSDVQPGMAIAQEEIFGPVLSVMRWRDEDEVLRWANSVEYGLTAAIWTRDVQRAHRFAREIEAGYVWINGSSRHFWGTPFGGYKASGVGREESLEELLSYTQIKTVHVMLG